MRIVNYFFYIRLRFDDVKDHMRIFIIKFKRHLKKKTKQLLHRYRVAVVKRIGSEKKIRRLYKHQLDLVVQRNFFQQLI